MQSHSMGNYNTCIGGGGVFEIRRLNIMVSIVEKNTNWLGDSNHVITLYSFKCYNKTQSFVDNNQLITLYSPKCWKKTKWLGDMSHLIRWLCKNWTTCIFACFGNILYFPLLVFQNVFFIDNPCDVLYCYATGTISCTVDPVTGQAICNCKGEYTGTFCESEYKRWILDIDGRRK